MPTYLEDWDRHFADRSGRRFWPNEELVRFIGTQKFNGILEVGCGDGANLRLLSKHATIDGVYGIDASPLGLAFAEDIVDADDLDVQLIQRSILDRLPFPDESIDLVVDCMVSQHIPWSQHNALYSECRRVLRPGGRLWLFHLDNRTQSERGSRIDSQQYDYDWLGLFPDVRYFCLPDSSSLLTLVMGSGFMVTRRWLERGYPDGQAAHYTIIEGTAR